MNELVKVAIYPSSVNLKYNNNVEDVNKAKNRKLYISCIEDIFEDGDYGIMKIVQLDKENEIEVIAQHRISEGEKPVLEIMGNDGVYLSLEEANKIANQHGFEIVFGERYEAD